MVSVRLDGSRVDVYGGRPFTQATASASAIGLADIVLRTKYTLFADHGSGIAGAIDVRLPTGRQENLLGAGAASLKFTGIGSIENGPATLHVNGGDTPRGPPRGVRLRGAGGRAGPGPGASFRGPAWRPPHGNRPLLAVAAGAARGPQSAR